jgi:predicted 3-demethylubiquinone-9 3-methyltransferase (glyoxalase superfamily)
MRMPTQKIVTFLWFDNNAEEAMNFYTSLFKDSKIVQITRNGPDGPGAPGTVLVGTFEIAGQTFMALNGGPLYKFNESISLFVNCETQAEVDDLWAKLTSDGGEPGQCGWLKDKFGLSWQITPTALLRLLGDKDPGRARRAMKAMMQMNKIDIAALQRAADQE